MRCYMSKQLYIIDYYNLYAFISVTIWSRFGTPNSGSRPGSGVDADAVGRTMGVAGHPSA
jgi:hypothetical protein